MNSAGQLRIHLDAARCFHLTLSRPSNLANYLQGKPAKLLLTTVPYVYTVCRHAHEYACALVLSRLNGEPLQENTAQRYRQASGLEALLEHLWSVFHHIPTALDLPPDKNATASYHRALKKQIEAIDHDASAICFDKNALLDTLAKQRDTLLATLHTFDWQTDGHWQLQDRLASLFCEIHALLDNPLALAQHHHSGTKNGQHFACVRTARGDLHYRLETRADIIKELSISAPTDRHFAKRGLAHRVLATLPPATSEQCLQRGKALIALINPCVPWEITSASQEPAYA